MSSSSDFSFRGILYAPRGISRESGIDAGNRPHVYGMAFHGSPADAELSMPERTSMDGRGRWRDNVMVERLWCSLKYECIYLHAFENVTEAHQRISEWIAFYNERRPHSCQGGLTPDMTYGGQLAKAA